MQHRRALFACLVWAAGCGPPTTGDEDGSGPAADLTMPPPGSDLSGMGADGCVLGTHDHCSSCNDECAGNFQCCGGKCVPLSDPMNCGTCGKVCSYPNAEARCDGTYTCGILNCNDGFSNCDGQEANGCEQNTGTDLAHCGMCDTPCKQGANTTAAVCTNGACGYAACLPNFGDCNKMVSDGCERDLASDIFNCGMCLKNCPVPAHTTAAACANGACGYAACVANYADCDKNPATGCESSVLSDGNNCGKCGTVCVSACKGGVCGTLVQIAVGDDFGCGRFKDGTASCWGLNFNGQLGDGSNLTRPTPAPVLNLTNVAELSAGGTHVCARLNDLTVRCWGNNQHGQLGDATVMQRTQPVTSIAQNVLGLAGGDQFTCARFGNGQAGCWGYNFWGQLGDGTTNESHAPVAVSGLTTVAEVVAGLGHACARLNDATVRCWGLNNKGQLGDGTLNESHVPVAVKNLTGVVQLTAGTDFTCARLGDKTARCWGANDRGQLGDGTMVDQKLPVQVKGITIVQIAAGAQHACAIGDDNLAGITCWGYNMNGQVGDGTMVNRGAPTGVFGLGAQLEGGLSHTCALLVDGTLYCWGANVVGQLGDGTMMDRNKPTLTRW
jgi:alpha-tubulin suppressor-like RCC1 family protein